MKGPKKEGNMDELEFIYWDNINNVTLIVNFTIAVAMFACLRFFLGYISHFDTAKELASANKPAFGISLAGGIIAVSIVLAGAIYGEPVFTVKDSVIAVGVYGILGILFMVITRLIFDRFALPGVSVAQELEKHNTAAGVIDAGNMIATSIVIYTVMIWVSDNSLRGVTDVVSGFLVSQVLLTLYMHIRLRCFAKCNDELTFDDQLKQGNVALALRFSGKRIGIAFAIAAASNLMVYEMYDSSILLAYWAGVAVVVMVAFSIIARIAQKLILVGIEVDKQVVHQANIAVGAVQCAVYVAMGILLVQLMG